MTGGETFDYLVVGAGAAGCVLAHRLSAQADITVCLLESGGPDRSPWIHIPAGFIKLAYDARYTWQITTEPSESTAGRRIPTTQGRTLGGSTAINGFNYTRGQPQDYDAWAAAGNPGWDFAHVLPYFRRSERRVGHFDPRYRGADGLLPVTDCDWRHPLCDGFIQGARELGVPENPDYNAARQDGAGYYQRWIQDGWRQSTAVAFLRPAMKRGNLAVRTGAHVTRILFEDGRAVGVALRRGPGQPERQLRARREVILCAGAANTPKLMMLSGLGPGDALQAAGIALQHHLPGVGRNLQDHFMVRSVCRVKGTPTLNEMARWPRLAWQVARWCMRRPSILAISPSVSYAFCRSDPSLDRPDLQFHFSPGSYRHGVAGLLDDFPGMTLGFYQLRPLSSGQVTLSSTDPFALPLVQPAYIAREEDRKAVVDGLRLARRMLQSRGLSPYLDRLEYPPAEVHTDQELVDFARARGGTAWHLMGTCRMGPASDPASVVDSDLRVIGVGGLRVADASIMPTMPSGNTQVPTMMIAEKAADLILGRAAPAPEYPQG